VCRLSAHDLVPFYRGQIPWFDSILLPPSATCSLGLCALCRRRQHSERPWAHTRLPGWGEPASTVPSMAISISPTASSPQTLCQGTIPKPSCSRLWLCDTRLFPVIKWIRVVELGWLWFSTVRCKSDLGKMDLSWGVWLSWLLTKEIWSPIVLITKIQNR
jgi:hypothetical protein